MSTRTIRIGIPQTTGTAQQEILLAVPLEEATESEWREFRRACTSTGLIQRIADAVACCLTEGALRDLCGTLEIEFCTGGCRCHGEPIEVEGRLVS